MPATAKTRGSSNSRGTKDAWPEGLSRALNELGSAKQKFPELFPLGITKIQLEFGVTEKTRIVILVEGPQKKSDVESRYP